MSDSSSTRGPEAAIHVAALERKGRQTVAMKGRKYREFVYVEAAALKTKRDLDHWLGLAPAYHSKAKASVRKRRQ